MDDTAAVMQPTGIPGLDIILGGGLQRGSLVQLLGSPGTGKTTLAGQVAWAAAAAGQRVLLLTALSEPSNKLLRHLERFTFFDPSLIGTSIQVHSLSALLSGKLQEAADNLIAEARRRRADLLVLDGFRSVRLAALSPLESRMFLYQVGAALGVQGVTTLVTAEGASAQHDVYAEATGADVVLELARTLHGAHARRTIELIKVRGASPLLGLHGLDIDQAGVHIAPRLEAIVRQQGRAAAPTPFDGTHATFNLPELDALVGGGLTRGTSTLVLGSPGTGKTLLALHFALAGIAAGEPAVFLSFQEDEAELAYKADAFALGDSLRAALAPGGGLTLLRQPPVECDADFLAEQLLQAIDRTAARRVVIDSIAEVERAVAETSDRSRIPNYVAALIEALRRRRITTLLIKEHTAVSTAALSLASDPMSVVAATVLWLQQLTYRDRLYRVMAVPKMRFGAHDVTLREFSISAPAGLVVHAPFESESGALAALSLQQGGRSSG